MTGHEFALTQPCGAAVGTDSGSSARASARAEAFSIASPGCDVIVARRLRRLDAVGVDQLESSSAAALIPSRVDSMVAALRSCAVGGAGDEWRHWSQQTSPAVVDCFDQPDGVAGGFEAVLPPSHGWPSVGDLPGEQLTVAHVGDRGRRRPSAPTVAAGAAEAGADVGLPGVADPSATETLWAPVGHADRVGHEPVDRIGRVRG